MALSTKSKILAYPSPRQLLLFVFLVVTAIKAVGQGTISGTTVDTAGKPVAQTSVLLFTVGTPGSIQSKAANSDGRFQISPVQPGRYFIRLSSVGHLPFQSDTFSLQSGENKELAGLRMVPAGTTLNNVVLTAKAAPIAQKNDRLVIQVKDNITASGSTVLDILERSPGVLVNRQSGTISVQGSEGVAVMLNGKLTYMPPSALMQLLSGMNSNSVEKIEIITAPGASLDAEGKGGYINIVTRAKQTAGLNGSLATTVGYGKGEIGDASAQLNYSADRLSLWGSYSFLRNSQDQFLTNFRRTVKDPAALERSLTSNRFPVQRNHGLRLGATYQLTDRTMLSTQANAYDNRWSMDAVNNIKVTSTTAADTLIRLDNAEINHWKHLMVNTSVQHVISKRKKLNLDADYLQYHANNPVQYNSQFFNENAAPIFSEKFRSEKKTPIRFWVLSGSYSYEWSRKLNVEFGAKLTASKLKNAIVVARQVGSEFVSDPLLSATHLLEENIAAAFGTAEYRPDSLLTIKGGLRFEHTQTLLAETKGKDLVNRRFGRIFPSMLLNRIVGKGQSTYLSYSSRITRPTFNEIAPFIIFIDPNTLFSGNPALKPAFTHSVKAGYNLKKYSASIFYTGEKGTIARFQPKLDTATNQQVFGSINLKRSTAYGLSILAPVKLARWWSVQHGITLTRQATEGLYEGTLLKAKKLNVQVTGSHQFSLPKDWSMELSGFYQSASLWGISELRAFGALNAGIRKKMGRGTLAFSANDVFNTNKMGFSATHPEVNQVIDFSVQLVPRNFRLSYTVSFGKNTAQKSGQRATASEEEQGRMQ